MGCTGAPWPLPRCHLSFWIRKGCCLLSVWLASATLRLSKRLRLGCCLSVFVMRLGLRTGESASMYLIFVGLAHVAAMLMWCVTLRVHSFFASIPCAYPGMRVHTVVTGGVAPLCVCGCVWVCVWRVACGVWRVAWWSHWIATCPAAVRSCCSHHPHACAQALLPRVTLHRLDVKTRRGHLNPVH